MEPATMPDVRIILEDSTFKNILNKMVQQIVINEIHSDINIEKRFSELEKGNALLLESVRTLESNIIVYREDTRDFMNRICKENENFREDMNNRFDRFRNEIIESNDQFRKEINIKFELIDKRFESIDGKFESIDNRFDFINKQFIEVHKAINRMTVFFISGLGTIVLLSKIIDKVWP